MRNDSWRLLVHESTCRNRMNVRRAKDLWSSNDHGQVNSELVRWYVWRWTWYKAISGLFAVLYETDAENYGEVLNVDAN